MNQAQKDRAWKVFEIAFYAALASNVIIHWKDFLGTMADVAREIISLALVALLVAFVATLFDSGVSGDLRRNCLMANLSGPQPDVQFCPRCKGDLRNLARHEMASKGV